MNRIPKFEIGDEVYTINEYKIGKGIVTDQIFVKSKGGEQLNYRLLCADNKLRVVNEAYIVKTLEEAKNSAQENASYIYNEMTESIKNLKEEDLIPLKKEENDK